MRWFPFCIGSRKVDLVRWFPFCIGSREVDLVRWFPFCIGSREEDLMMWFPVCGTGKIPGGKPCVMSSHVEQLHHSIHGIYFLKPLGKGSAQEAEKNLFSVTRTNHSKGR